MIDNKLRVIDFSAAVKSEPLNFNFDVVKGWVDRERLRIGGYGLVEGFDLSYDGHFGVDITEGVLIDRKGQEIMVPAVHLLFEEPAYEKITEQVEVQSDGTFTLKYRPYSPSNHGIIFVDAIKHTPYKSDEFSISDTSSGLGYIRPVAVDGRKVSVNSRLAKEILDVTYCYCDDRIDAIMVDENTIYSKEIGINAISPSEAHVELGPRFLIALAHWIIGETISVEFIIDDRTYRKVYVDRQNRLYLNGKLYKEQKFIYFEEPQNPDENDIWYDYKTNTLNIWSNQNGVYGWRIMNDFTNVPLRDIKIWTPNNFPKDMQTFKFRDDELNFRYIPNTNALEIIIDQQTVMSDQFSEITIPGTKPYLSSGIGFRLNTPLDRATVVQCIVHHTVKNAPLREVFQRAAVFVSENFHLFDQKTNTTKVFKTDLPYVIGADQLEVFVNGARLNKDVDFVEMTDSTNEAHVSDKDKTTQYFKVKAGISNGTKITYKISRYVWSYDQLNEMTKEIEKKADDALDKNKVLDAKIQTLSDNISRELTNIKGRLQTAEAQLKTLSNYRKKADQIIASDLSPQIRAGLVKSKNTYEFNASNPNNVIPDCKSSDLVSVICKNTSFTETLIETLNYSLRYTGNDAILDLDPELTSPDNTVYVTIVRMGRQN